MTDSSAGSSSPDIAGRSRIIERIERDAGVPNLTDVLVDRLAPTDLQSLLLEVYGRRAKKRDPKELIKDHISNRFTRPSTASPTRLLEWDHIAFSQLPKVFQSVELSPVCPLGTVSALSPISQDWTVSTIRNTDVAADSTNVLAIECAVRRREQRTFSSGKAASVHLAASHRLLRGQKFGVGPDAKQHFRIFTLCSAGRDTGNLMFETESLGNHVGFYLAALGQFLGTKRALRVAISDFGSKTPRAAVQSGVLEKLRSRYRRVKVGIDQSRTQGRGYYGELCFKIFANDSTAKEQELVDGGDVNWT